MRSFVAIDVPDDICAALELLQDDLPVGRLTVPGTFHLTLAFLDDQPQHLIEAVHEQLALIRFEPFDVQLRGVDIFGGREPRLLWSGVAPQPGLGALRHRVRRACADAGVKLRREKFRPHVTLARFSRRMAPDDLARVAGFLTHHAGFECAAFPVDRYALYRSTLTPVGAVHEMLQDYPAQGSVPSQT
ncbi:MAG: RNA 2',3'-cyclic phosphodiesterase [Rhodobacter sp.]|nr:RNA 2',3'-cyclic phosphodiesterase [Rhodobacter sp.]